MSETSEVKTIQRESIVLRMLWLLVFVLVWQVGAWVLGITVVLQALYRLIRGWPSAQLARFGASLSQYLAQIGRFGSFATEQKPWPFSAWPQESSTPETRVVVIERSAEEPRL